jgi:hypothetical protein
VILAAMSCPRLAFEASVPSAIRAQGLAAAVDTDLLFWVSAVGTRAHLEVCDAGTPVGSFTSPSFTASTRMAASRDGELVATCGTVGGRKPKVWVRGPKGYKAQSPALGLSSEVASLGTDLPGVLIATDTRGGLAAWRPAEKRVVASACAPRSANYLGADSEQGKVWLCVAASIYAWDLASGALAEALVLPPVYSTVAMAGEVIAVGYTDEPKAWVGRLDGSAAFEIDMPERWVGVGGMTSDGRRVLFTPHNGREAVVVECATQRRLAHIPMRAGFNRFRMFPGGASLLGVRDDPDQTVHVEAIDAETGAKTTLWTCPGRATGYARSSLLLATSRDKVALLVQDHDAAVLAVFSERDALA